MVRSNYCGIRELYKQLGKRWSLILLHNFNGQPLSFNDLYSITKGRISNSLLSLRIKEFRDLGLITPVDHKNKKKYLLTERGSDLKKILLTIRGWGQNSGLIVPEKCSSDEFLCGNKDICHNNNYENMKKLI